MAAGGQTICAIAMLAAIPAWSFGLSMSAGRSETKPSAKSAEFFLVAQPAEPHGLSRRSLDVRRAAGSWSSLFSPEHRLLAP